MEKLIQPLPWHAERRGQFSAVIDPNGFAVLVSVTHDEAEFIARAANCHDDLLAALKKALRHMDVHPGSVWSEREQADAAIAKAEATHGF